ncbi:MAG: chromosomal replication initiator protein DnaA [Christensenellales bacterium]
MNFDLQNAWNMASQALRLQLSEMSYENFIKPIVPVSYDREQVVLMLQREYQINYVRQRYSIFIENALEQVTGVFRKVIFVLPAEAKERASQMRPQNNILLNPKYTFDNFVVGSSNRFAHAASMAVSNSVGAAYNPLFIYGGVGLGKTHLMHAIGNHIIRYKPDIKLLYVTSESFTNELISAIQSQRNIELREKYRTLDILLIDDIQFIAGKVSTQEEIFHTFNALYQSGKQIVLSSDKHPKDIQMLEERLVSRFESGLVADITKPDFETTVAILRKKAEVDGLFISEDVFVMIAQHVFSSVREMEGCLTRITAYAAVTGRPIDVELAQEVMRDMKSIKDPKRITADVIIDAVSEYYDISVLDMKSQKRSREIAVPRQVAMYLIRDMLSMSLPRIGAEFSGRDHTTVMHSCEKITNELKTDYRLRQNVEDLRKIITE